jgi:hypothetical protein
LINAPRESGVARVGRKSAQSGRGKSGESVEKKCVRTVRAPCSLIVWFLEVFLSDWRVGRVARRGRAEGRGGRRGAGPGLLEKLGMALWFSAGSEALWKWFLRISKTKAKIELCVPQSISLWSILIVYIKTERTLIGLTPPRSNRACTGRAF